MMWEKRPKRKCMKRNHLPGVLSLSNEFLVCEICNEVFDYINISDDLNTFDIVELGDWPGSERKISLHKERDVVR